MVTKTQLEKLVKADFLAEATKATSAPALERILERLPIVSPDAYSYERTRAEHGWQANMLHWIPVGMDPGNAGRIKLGPEADNRIGERVVNMIESLIELERQKELLTNPQAPMPASPREAVLRYFGLPPLPDLPVMADRALLDKARALSERLKVRVFRHKDEDPNRPYTLLFADEGVGQTPERVVTTILGLGSSDKIDKPYLIGMFGQGGSSAFASSLSSWVVSRRAPELVAEKDGDGVAWTVVRRISQLGIRRPYYAYLAAHPDGSVPSLPASFAATINLTHGTRIAHIGFDMATLDPTKLYQALNHLLFAPLLPFSIYTRKDPTRADRIMGVGYLLSRLSQAGTTIVLDKSYPPLSVVAKENR